MQTSNAGITTASRGPENNSTIAQRAPEGKSAKPANTEDAGAEKTSAPPAANRSERRAPGTSIANYLTVGLPLLLAIDRPRILAVMAHEYGHLRGGHGRFAAWIYRTRLSWARLDRDRFWFCGPVIRQR